MIRVGIGGWTYEPWRGTFYPPKLPQAKEIAFATEAMTAIEVNGTFYSRQSPKTFAKWAETAPEGFVYALKASRFCTNRKNLADGEESIRNFFDQGLVELGSKLGPILWQLAGTKKFNADEIAGFLKLLPKEWGGLPLRHALEPRHDSFDDPAYFELARKANVATVYAHAADYPTFDEQTTDFTYARLQQCREDEETGYSAKELDAWAAKAKEWEKGGRDVFVFFIAGAKVRAPAAAQALIERVGRS